MTFMKNKKIRQTAPRLAGVNRHTRTARLQLPPRIPDNSGYVSQLGSTMRRSSDGSPYSKCHPVTDDGIT